MRHSRLLASAVSAAMLVAAAACSKSDSTPSSTTSSTTSSCTVTLGTVTTNVGAGASSGTLPVTAASGCSWTAVSSASFLTVTSGATGTGNGSVGYSFAANTGAARSASITVNGTSTVFTQAAQLALAPTGCSVTVSPTTTRANSGGGTVTISVTGDSSCSWNATSNASFLTVPSTTSAGNGNLVVTAAANNGGSRSGTVTVGGRTVTITQDPGIFASFMISDPGQSATLGTICQIRSQVVAAVPTTCQIRSTSFTQGAATIVNYRWFVQYTYVESKTLQQDGPSPNFSITETCGQANGGTTDDGAFQPLVVQLVVTDSLGNTATANTGVGDQPALRLQLFNCNR